MNALLPGIVWIDKQALVADLMSIQGMLIEWGLEDIDVRVQWLDGSYELHWGDSQFDADHRGNWGYSTLSNDLNQSEIVGLAEELIEAVENDVIENPQQWA